MKRVSAPFAVVLASTLLLCGIAFPQVESMKLLTPEVGWAGNRQRLLWTTTGGNQWKEITPTKPSAGEHIEAVFFLDSSTGWVLWSQYAEPQPRYDVSATSNSGASWTSVRIPITVSSVDVPLSEGAGIFFLDASHGWINVSVQGSASAHPGAMLRTNNGGSTWEWMGMVSRGSVYFTTPNDGWIVSPAGDELAATHDGAKTWQDIALLPPSAAEVYGDYNTTYHLPTLQDNMHGYLEVEFSYGSEFSSGARSVRVLFSTNDGGRTWKFVRKLPDVTLTQFASGGMETGSDAAASEVADSVWVAASVRGRKTLVLTRTPLAPGQAGGATMSVDVSKYRDLYGLRQSEQISFVDVSHGWLLPGRLLATADGGATWADITPSQLVPPARPSISVPANPVLIPNKPTAFTRPPTVGERPSYPFPSSSDVSIHLGFDISAVILSSYMGTWWNLSPYFDTSLYLPGSPNRGTDKNLNASWVSTVQGQGWGIIPIWFGLQSPCSCKTGSPPNCTTYFSSQFSSNTTTANSQGITEADSAITSLKNLQSQGVGIALGTIIYHDIENYAPSTSCSPPVKAFLAGWVSEMHAKGYQAGVYANPSPISSDVSKVSPLPDDIWVAKYDNRVTTFGLGFSDSLWPKDQRMHQVQQNLNQSFGGAGPFKVDPDIDDAQIAAGLGAKGYSSFNFSEIAYPGATQTVPQGINDLNSTGGFINASQTGEVVGAYYNSTGPVNAFLDNSGAFTNVNNPNATNGTVAYDISNQKYIVGAYGTNTTTLGYLQKGTGSPSTINCTGSTYTAPPGINDDAQIAGFDIDSVGLHGFFLKTSTGTCQLYDGLYPDNAQAIGINGDGQIVGFYNDGSQYHGFLWNVDTDGSIATVDIAGAMGTQLFYINNNGQITGQYRDSSGNWNPFLYEEATDSYQLLPNDPNACSPGCSGVIGVNDSAQVTGQYTATVSGLIHGFLATPQ